MPEAAPPERRYHILTFDVGERFRYREGGPIFTRVGDPKGPVKVRREGARVDALAEIENTFVLPVDLPSGNDGDWDGLGLTGFDPASGEEGGGL